MLKTVYPMKEVALAHRATEALRALLRQVRTIGLIEFEPQGADCDVDFLVHFRVAGRRQALVCEVKASGQPRHVRMALLQLRDVVARFGVDATPVFIAPYLSPEAQAVCREHEAGFLDLEGNARLVFDGVFIERLVASKPAAERRGLKSIFKPKSAQVLRVLLRAPPRAWRVAGLAEAAGVSLGHVSNVRVALLNREWARVEPGGLSLAQPDALLDAWRTPTSRRPASG